MVKLPSTTYTKTSVGQIKELGGAGSITLQDVTANGSITDRTITMNGANFIFEGNLEDAFETTLTIDEPTDYISNALNSTTTNKEISS